MTQKSKHSRSVGALALEALLESHGGVVRVAEAVETTEGTIRHAIAGRASPRKQLRARLEAVFGIAESAWDRESGSEPPAAKAPDPPLELPPPSDDVKGMAIETIRVLRGHLSGASHREAGRISQAIAAQSRILARASGQFEITQAQIVRSPHFRELLGVIERALEPYPDAVRAVAKAFEELRG
jgi:hypothetical protein